MADTKISGLSAVTDVLATDEYVLARSGTTKKIDASDLATGLGAGVGGRAGDLLALFVQTAGSNVTTTSSTQADVDATNAAVTFTAPASGNVLVRVTVECSMSAAFQNGRLGLREATTNIAGPHDALVGLAAASTFQTVSLAFRVAGISGGSHTYKLAYSVTGGATMGVLQIGSTANNFPVTIEVWAAP